MKKLFLLFFCLISFSIVSDGQGVERSKFIKDSLQNYVTRALTNWRIPGAAVCIIKDGKIVMAKGFGVKELGQNNKVDENTLFMIGSNTKAFTATALATLQSANKLSLDDKVTKYVPEFKLDNKFAGEQAIVRDLLCHRLGFKTFEGDFTFYNTNLSRAEVIEKMGHLKAAYPFRTKWGYTNSAFVVAGEIITKVTGKSWEAYIKDNIFAPLGMGNTLALTKDINTSINKAAPHTLANNQLIAIPFMQNESLAPAGAISSSANDMGKWVMALLNDGKVGKRQVIPAAAINETRVPQSIIGESDMGGYLLYGLGWELQDYKGHHIVSHTGGVNGFVSSVTLVPDQKLGIVILTNTDHNNLIETLNWNIIDAYLKLPYRDYMGIALNQFKEDATRGLARDKKLRDSVLLNLRPPLPLNNYAGKYFNDLYGNMTITQGENNDLEMRFEHHPKMFARLQSLGNNRFYVTFSDPEFGKAVFPFAVQNGRVTGVRVKVADFIEYDAYDFKKVQ